MQPSDNHYLPHPGYIIFFLAVGAFAIGTTEFATMTLLPQMAADLQIDDATAGHIISAYAMGVVVGAPVLALIASNWSRRLALVCLMAFFMCAHLALIFAPNYHTVLVLRFLSGFPHGAYLGIASLLAGGLLGSKNRGKAVSRVMLGLTLATVIGAPLTNFFGQYISWRLSMAVAAVAASICVFGLLTFIPRGYRQAHSDLRHELGALGNPQIWLTLGCGAIGFGGMFAVYTYLASLLDHNLGTSNHVLPWIFFLMGMGLTIGNLVLGYFTDKSVKWSVIGILLWSFIWLITFPLISEHTVWVGVWVLMIGMGGGFGTALQVRLMDVAGKAQTIAAALNHSAFNFANALGPFLSGLAIAAGYPYSVIGYIGAGLAVGGLAIWLFSLRCDQH